MAVEIISSDLITAYKNKQRVRSMNSGGTLLCSYATNTDTFMNKDNGSVLHVSLIPVSSIIDHIDICFSDKITDEQGILSIGFYGINQSGDFVDIQKDAFGAIKLGGLDAGESFTIIPKHQNFGKTVYETLCNNNIPIEKFEPFKNCENVVLSFTIQTKNDTTNPQTCLISVRYINGSPSTTSLTSLTIDKE